MTYIDFFKACALTSAAAPKLDIMEAGVMTGEGDEKIGVNALEIRTASNRRCVSYLSKTQAGISALKERERAEEVLEGGLDLSEEGVKVERPLLGSAQEGLEGEGYFVLICSFSPGAPSPLRGLSEEECLSFGKAVGAVHSEGPEPFQAFKTFSAPSIRFELREWVERLRNRGCAPGPVLDAWEELAATDALWDFSPSLVHGGWKAGEARFAGGSVSALLKWERAEVSDPARDLEWMFEENLGQRQTDAFMQGYGMAMGDSMDPFILPRAKLWRQMEMGAALLEAQKGGQEEKARGLSQKLLRLSEELRQIVPKKPAAPLPEGVEPPAAPPQQMPSQDPEVSSTRVQPKAEGESEKKEEKEEEEAEKEGAGKAEEPAKRDPAINAALWQVAVRAALAQREGRDLQAELDAQKAAAEAAEDPEEKSTSMFSAMSFAADKEAPSLGAPVRVKEGGSAMDGGEAPQRQKPPKSSTALLGSPFAPQIPPQDEPSESTTKVIEKIDGNTNE